MIKSAQIFLFQAALLVSLSAGNVALAHDGGSHMSGVVSAIDTKANTLTLQDGKQTTVIDLTKSTKYVKDKKTAALTDLKTGLRVVVHVQMDEKTKKYTAQEVEIGVADAAAKVAAPTPAGGAKK